MRIHKNFLKGVYLILINTMCLIFFACVTQAGVANDVNRTIEEVNKFHGILDINNPSETIYKKAESHLKSALKRAKRINLKRLESYSDKKFVREWRAFSLALEHRLKGWQTMDVSYSALGITGIDRFRNYYLARQKK